MIVQVCTSYTARVRGGAVCVTVGMVAWKRQPLDGPLPLSAHEQEKREIKEEQEKMERNGNIVRIISNNLRTRALSYPLHARPCVDVAAGSGGGGVVVLVVVVVFVDVGVVVLVLALSVAVSVQAVLVADIPPCPLRCTWYWFSLPFLLPALVDVPPPSLLLLFIPPIYSY